MLQEQLSAEYLPRLFAALADLRTFLASANPTGVDYRAVALRFTSFKAAIDPSSDPPPLKSVRRYIKHHAQAASAMKVPAREFPLGTAPWKLKFDRPVDALFELQTQTDLPEAAQNSTVAISVAATLWEIGRPREVHVDVGDTALLLYDAKEVVECVMHSDIVLIVPRGERALEVFTARAGSLYLDFGTVGAVMIVEKFIDVGLKMAGEAHVGMVLARPVSNFEYLVILGTMAGRSFHVDYPPFEFPVGEELVGLEKVASPTGDFKEIYENRRSLEAQDVQEFAVSTYGGLMAARPQPPRVEPVLSFAQRDLLVPEGAEVLRADFLGSDVICMTLTTSTLQFVSVADKPQILASQRPAVPGDCLVMGDHVIIVGPRNLIQFISPKTLGPVVEMPCSVGFPRAVSDTMLFVSDECVVYKSTRSDPAAVHELLVAPERVCGIEICESFDAIAVIAIDNILRMYALTTGELTALVRLAGEPEKVIITPGWGFIGVASGRNLSAYTINGDKVGAWALHSESRAWATFADQRKLDFLVVVDDDNSIGVFELGRLEDGPVTLDGRRFDLLTVQWIEARKCVAAVTREGVLALYPVIIK
jgi:hypothetical protein